MKRNIALGLALLAMSLLMPSMTMADGVFTATLVGTNETPPNASAATGFITVTLTGNTLSVVETFSGLTTLGSAAHIHCCAGPGVAAGVAVPFTGFPSALSGSYSQTFDLTQSSVYLPAFETAQGGTAASAESALLAALFSGQTYANIHDTTFPGGEIRGQLIQTPESSTLVFLAMGLAGLVARKRWGKA